MTRRIEPLDAERLGLRLKNARRARGMTLKQVAVACEMHYGQLSKIERGQFSFLNEKLQKICKSVGVNPDAPDGTSADELHVRLDRLMRDKPGAVVALRAVLDALDQMAN
jgi:transcriptional regulator with XRE-family HTH domain